MKNLTETDINRFIEAQKVPCFCGYKQALDEVKNGRKTNIGYGIFSHNSVAWDVVAGLITMESQIEKKQSDI